MSKFDPAAATAAYLAQLPPEAHVKAQHYTQGGHWLLLWGFLVSVAVAWMIIRTGVLTRVQQGVERRKARPFLASFLVAAVFVAFSLYLIGTHEADDAFAAATWLPILGGIFLAPDND